MRYLLPGRRLRSNLPRGRIRKAGSHVEWCIRVDGVFENGGWKVW